MSCGTCSAWLTSLSPHMRHAVRHRGSNASASDSVRLAGNPKATDAHDRRVQSNPIGKVNWSRVVGCGLLAGVVWIILGSVVTTLLGQQFAALPNNRLGTPTPVSFCSTSRLTYSMRLFARSIVPARRPQSLQLLHGGSSSLWEAPHGVPSAFSRRAQSSR